MRLEWDFVLWGKRDFGSSVVERSTKEQVKAVKSVAQGVGVQKGRWQSSYSLC